MSIRSRARCRASGIAAISTMALLMTLPMTLLAVPASAEEAGTPSANATADTATDATANATANATAGATANATKSSSMPTNKLTSPKPVMPSQEVPTEDLARYEPFTLRARAFLEGKDLDSNDYRYVVYDQDEVIAVALRNKNAPRGMRGGGLQYQQYTLRFDRASGELVHEALMR